ncbi:MAG: hypothetical protein U0R78_14225 [Nocardioidaceae bacterium]
MFPEELRDWQELELAAYYLGRAIGIFAGAYGDYKSTIEFSNPISEALTKCLMALVDAGLLEYKGGPDFQVRWVTGAEADEWFLSDGTPLAEAPDDISGF